MPRLQFSVSWPKLRALHRLRPVSILSTDVSLLRGRPPNTTIFHPRFKRWWKAHQQEIFSLILSSTFSFLPAHDRFATATTPRQCRQADAEEEELIAVDAVVAHRVAGPFSAVPLPVHERMQALAVQRLLLYYRNADSGAIVASAAHSEAAQIHEAATTVQEAIFVDGVVTCTIPHDPSRIEPGKRAKSAIHAQSTRDP